MSLTYGFYNSVNKDRLYNATQFSQIFDGIINDGIYMSVLNHFSVRSANNGMDILVGSGRAWFNHTWSYNDTDYLMTVSSSEIAAKRIDAVVLKIDTRDTSRINTIEIINGTPSENEPEKPTFIDENGVYYHPLAYITIDAGITEITDVMIENAIGIDPRTPFVTGIIEHIHAEDLINQWQIEWDEWNQEHRDAYINWVNQQETDMENWISAQETDMENWEASQKESFLEWMADEKSGYTSWLNTSKQEFDDWFENLHYILDGDVAAHLQNEIDELNDKVDNDIKIAVDNLTESEFNHYYDLCNRSTHYTRDENENVIGWTATGDDGITMTVTITETDVSKTFTYNITDGTSTWIRTATITGDDLVEEYRKAGAS